MIEIRCHYGYVEIGRLFATLWWGGLWAWGLSYHSASCCRFYVEIGPLEMGWAR